jgi:hypothetical protein
MCPLITLLKSTQMLTYIEGHLIFVNIPPKEEEGYWVFFERQARI